MNNKLQGKDLINIGIFTAIYFIVIFAAASIGFIPIFIPLISVIVPLVGGIPMMLFSLKSEVWDADYLRRAVGNYYAADRHGLLVHPHWLDLWVIADFMLKACDYKNAKREVLTHGAFFPCGSSAHLFPS